MTKPGKKTIDAQRGYDREQEFPPLEAIELVKSMATRNFDETIEAAVRLGVDPRKADQMIRGLVLEFVKSSPPAGAADHDLLHPLATQVLSTVPHPLMLIDRQLRLVWANLAFFEAFAVGPGAWGRALAEAWGSASDPAELWVFLEQLVSGQSPRDILIAHPFSRTTEEAMRFTGRLVPTDNQRVGLAMVFMAAV